MSGVLKIFKQYSAVGYLCVLNSAKLLPHGQCICHNLQAGSALIRHAKQNEAL